MGDRADGEQPRKKTKWDVEGPPPKPSPLPHVPLPGPGVRPAVRTKVLTIPALHKGALIGKGGEAISAIRSSSGAEIHIRHTESEPLVAVTISGSNIELAEKLIGERLAASGRSTEGWDLKIVDVPQELIGPTIGNGGCNLRELQEATGCTFKFMQASHVDPSATTNKEVACIRGPPDKLPAGEKALLAKVAEVQQLRASKHRQHAFGKGAACGSSAGVIKMENGCRPAIDGAAGDASGLSKAGALGGKGFPPGMPPGMDPGGKAMHGCGTYAGLMGKGAHPAKGMDMQAWDGPGMPGFAAWGGAPMGGPGWDGMDEMAAWDGSKGGCWDGKGGGWEGKGLWDGQGAWGSWDGMEMADWYMAMWNSWWGGCGNNWRGKKPQIPCKFQMRGYCKNAERCSFSHDPEVIAAALGAGSSSSVDGSQWDPGYKMIYCKYWDSGKCTRCATCTFAHGIDELRGGLTPENLSLMDEAQQMMPGSLKPDEVEQRLMVMKSTATHVMR